MQTPQKVKDFNYLDDIMQYAQEQWRTPGIRDTWKDDTWHGVWWALHALAHEDRKAVECAKAYLELAMREVKG